MFAAVSYMRHKKTSSHTNSWIRLIIHVVATATRKVQRHEISQKDARSHLVEQNSPYCRTVLYIWAW
ncbi:unnamed protein product [Periconia digitata]|uniref:Uncharacterized protein n=1 Tax=Periconia digitata TaxID=1303443 RepID=A0A9W4UNF7_9PLEO|nr:unnamed protein product [Periconia digitata]